MTVMVNTRRTDGSVTTTDFCDDADARGAVITLMVRGAFIAVEYHSISRRKYEALSLFLEDVREDERPTPTWDEMVDHWVWALAEYYSPVIGSYTVEERYGILHDLFGHP